jgi:hypothetical protein
MHGMAAVVHVTEPDTHRLILMDSRLLHDSEPTSISIRPSIRALGQQEWDRRRKGALSLDIIFWYPDLLFRLDTINLARVSVCSPD